MQVVNEYEFGSDKDRCWVIKKTFMLEDEEKIEIKTPMFEEITSDCDIGKYSNLIQAQISAWRESQ